MNKNGSIVLRSVVIALLFTTASKRAYSCDSIHDYDALNGRILVAEVTKDQQDILVTLEDETGVQKTFDSPLGRFGKQYVLLTPEVVVGQFSLCIENKNGQPNTQSTVQLLDISQAPNQVFETLNLMTEASKQWMLKDFSSARALWQQAISLPLPDDYQRYLTQAYLAHISASIHQFDYQSAVSALNSLAKHNRFGPEIQYKIDWLQAQVYVRNSQNKLAIDALRDALEIMPEHLIFDATDIRSLLATALIQSGELDSAQIELERSLENSGSDGVQMARTLDTLGFLYIEKAKQAVEPVRANHFDQALSFEHQALDALSNINLPDTENILLPWQHVFRNQILRSKARVNNNLGTIYERLGEVNLAHYHYKAGLEFAELSRFDEAKAFFNKNVGMMYQYLGDYESAMQFQSVSVDLFESSVPIWHAIVSCQLGKSQQEFGLWEDALGSFQACYDFFSDPAQDQEQTEEAIHEKSRYMVLSQYLIAETYLLQEQFELASSSTDKVTHLIEQVSDPDLLLIIGLVDAQIHAHYGDSNSALNSAQAAIQAAKLSRYPSADMAAYSAAAIIAESYGNPDLAKRYLSAGIEIAQSLYIHLDPDLLAPVWTGKAQELYDKQIANLIKNPPSDFSRLATLFSSMESARGVSYRLKARSDYVANKARADKRLKKIGTLSNQKVLVEDKHSKQITTEISYQKFLLNAVSTSKNELDSAITLDKVQSSLTSEDLVLFYTFIEDKLYVMSITQASIKWHELADTQRVTDTLLTLRNALSDPNKPYKSTIKQFSDLILPDGDYWGSSKSLFIVPHKDLYSVPFSALSRTPRYQPLATNYRIKIIPSLSRFVSKLDSDNADPVGLQAMTVFHDPEFSPQKNETDDVARDTWTDQISPLVFSSEEGESILAIMGEKPIVAFSGQQATKGNLLSEQSRTAPILHISTHGHFNEHDPANVGLAVTPEFGTNRYVTKFDIHSHRFSNQLVVLSGCDTNRGKVLAGEGPQSLARTFLMSGADNVISTLWPVSDRASSIIMKHFYQHLADGKTVDESLAEAQTDMLNNFRFRHPFYWAAYTLQSTTNSRMSFE